MLSKYEFHKITNKNDIKEDGLLGTELEGNNIVLAMIDRQVFTMNAVCFHKDAPLEESKLE